MRESYEEHHKLTITDEALKAAAELAARYVSDRFLPDKAIDLIDEAASHVRIRKAATPPSMQEAVRGLESLRKEKDQAIGAQQYEFAAELRDRELKLQDRIEKMEQGRGRRAARSPSPTSPKKTSPKWSRCGRASRSPRIASEESERLLHMEDALRAKVIGQEEAITAITKAVRRSRAGLKDPRRPIGVFLFLGPTGVGKTYLPKHLAEFMFGSQDAMIRLDMSEFMEKHNVSRLVGAPPGYVGYDDGGQLTDTVRRKSYCLILLDEIEKAHPDVFNMLLQVFDDGSLTDAKGRKVDFRNTIIIMTSNVGSDLIRRESALGFYDQHGRGEDGGAAVPADEGQGHGRAQARLPARVPQPHRRPDRLPLAGREHIRIIVDLQLNEVSQNLLLKGISMEATDAARDWLGEKGYDPVFGARPLRRVIQNELEDRLSEALLEGRFGPGDTVLIDAEAGEIVLTKQEAPALASST